MLQAHVRAISWRFESSRRHHVSTIKIHKMNPELFNNIDVVGIYGAVIGTLIFLWELFKAYLKRRRIIVHGGCTLLQLANGQWKSCLSATVTNQSNMNYDIESIWFIGQMGNKILQARDDYPQLAPGGGYTFRFHRHCLGNNGYEQTLNSKRIVIQTTDRKIWKSKLFPYYDGTLIKRWWQYRIQKKKFKS